jgi:hypothetical protein
MLFQSMRRAFGIDEAAARADLHDAALCLETSYPAGIASGFAAETRLCTPAGWRSAESITVGDHVMTFDHGWQMVTMASQGFLWQDAARCPEHLLPLDVPAGALGNAQPMRILPESHVLVEEELAEILYGDAFVLVPASELEGYHGIARTRPAERIRVICLGFEADELVLAEGGAFISCPKTALWETLPLDHVADEAAAFSGCPVLAAAQARDLVAGAGASRPGMAAAVAVLPRPAGPGRYAAVPA